MLKDVSRSALLPLLLGASIIGTNALMVKMADMPPTVSAFWRMAISSVILGGVLKMQGGWKPMSPRAWVWSIIPGIAFSIDLWMWHRSIHIVGPGISTLLANTQVFFVAVASVVFFKDRLDWRYASGVLLAFFGLWLLLGGDWDKLSGDYHWGVFLGLATGLAYAFYNVGIKKTQQISEASNLQISDMQILFIAAVISSVMLGIFGFMGGEQFAFKSVPSFAYILALAVFGHCLAWVLISRAMRLLPIAVLGLLLLFQPIVAYMLDVVLFQIETTPRQWIGILVTLVGIFAAGLKPSSK